MKKSITILLTVILLLSVTACSKNGNMELPYDSTAANMNETNATDVTNESESNDAGNPTTGQSQNGTEATTSQNKETAPTAPTHTHSYASKTTDPTCTKDGYTTYTCSCGDNYISDKLASVGHKFGDWNTTKEPTEKTTGVSERKCSVCAAVETKILGKLIENHTHGYEAKVIRSATCTKEGVKTFSCSCGESYTESIAKISHNYKESVTNVTCTKDGYTTHKCTVCNDTYVDNRIKALGHAYTDTVVHSTCTTPGFTKHVCSRCKTSYTDKHTIAKGHAYSIVSDTATCTTNGTKIESCTRCGITKISTSIAFGHKTKVETVNATCLTNGYTKEICTTCGAVVSNKTTAATGHIWIKATCNSPKTCSKCGVTDGSPLSHNYEDGKCSACGHKQTNIGKWESTNLDGELLSVTILDFSNDRVNYRGYYQVSTMDPAHLAMLLEHNCEIITYQGIEYINEVGDGDIISCEISGDTISVRFVESWGSTTMTRISPNQIKVTAVMDNPFFVKTGWVFTYIGP